MDPSPAPPPLSLGQLLYERTPRVFVTPAIIAVDVALFVAMIVTSGDAAFSRQTQVTWGAQYAPLIAAGEWWRLLTAMWLHAHPPHLILNMLVLWQLGAIVERLLGPLVFLIVYVLAGVIASVASLAYHSSIGLSVGASGAIFGIAGVLLIVAFTGGGALMADLRGSLVGFVAYNAIAGFVLPRVDNAAHFGGLAGGVVVGWLVGRHSLRARPRLVHTLIPIALTAALAAWEVHRVAGQQDVRTEHAPYTVVAEAAHATFRSALADIRAGRRSPDSLAAEIERDVPPQLEVARQRADALHRGRWRGRAAPTFGRRRPSPSATRPGACDPRAPRVQARADRAGAPARKCGRTRLRTCARAASSGTSREDDSMLDGRLSASRLSPPG